jgi:hypothetical protein
MSGQNAVLTQCVDIILSILNKKIRCRNGRPVFAKGKGNRAA